MNKTEALTDWSENKIAEIVFQAGLKVHRSLGPGLLESAYEACLFYELEQYEFLVERQVKLPIIYEEVKLDAGYCIDLLIDKRVVIELKAVESIHPVHTAQLITYLKLSDCKLGLLINFNATLFKNGFKRIINGNLEE